MTCYEWIPTINAVFLTIDNASMVIFGGLVIVHIAYKRHLVERVNVGLTYVLFSFITSLILLGLVCQN